MDLDYSRSHRLVEHVVLLIFQVPSHLTPSMSIITLTGGVAPLGDFIHFMHRVPAFSQTLSDPSESPFQILEDSSNSSRAIHFNASPIVLDCVAYESVKDFFLPAGGSTSTAASDKPRHKFRITSLEYRALDERFSSLVGLS